MIVVRELTLTEHELIYRKLEEMQKAGLVQRVYAEGSLVLVWRWTDEGRERLQVAQSQEAWEVAARCILAPNRW